MDDDGSSKKRVPGGRRLIEGGRKRFLEGKERGV